MTITFANTTLPYGVDNLILTFGDFTAGNNDAISVTLYDASGAILGTETHDATAGTTFDISALGYSGVASLDLWYSGPNNGNDDAELATIDYTPTPASGTYPVDTVTLDQTGGDNGSNLTWVYNYDYDLEGNPVFDATVTDSADGSTFILRSNGYYNYTPSIPPATSVDLISQANVDASDLSISIRAGGTAYSSTVLMALVS